MKRGTLLCLTLVLGALAHAETITTGTLVEQMGSLSQLAEYPSPDFRTIQFSSYDRRSTQPGGPEWFANSDGFGGEPIPNVEAVLQEPQGDGPGTYLLCDVEGPGAIVRTWTARMNGTIRLFLDGATQPLYDGPAEEFLRFPYDTFLGESGIDRPTLDGTFYQREAAYAPIPFATRCRIEWTGSIADLHFYEVQMRHFDPGTDVATFTPGDLKTYAAEIKRTAGLLASTDTASAPEGSETIAIDERVRPGRKGLVRIKGAGAIAQLELKVQAEDLDMALRQTLLYIQFDSAPWPQVQAPIGDFFGAGPGINPYTSLPFTVAAEGTMTCRYLMPFREDAQILFENRGKQDVTITGAVHRIPYTWNEESSMHFRAKWRIDHDLVASGAATLGVQDLPFLVARGQGVYVGTAIMLLNPNNVPTPHGNWWGEGDEKIFVDDDVRPSTFGTGSEDYFNYAWSSPDIFVFPYCGQPKNDGPANRGFVVNYRWHILDPLPFEERIAFYMELFSHEVTPGVSYGRIAYHYAKPGAMDDHLPLTDEDLRVLTLPATWEPEPRGGAARATFHAAETLAQDSAANTQLEEGALWQGAKLLVWTPQAAGEKLTLTFSVEEAARYGLALYCKLSPESGPVKIHLDGQPLGDARDLTTDFRTLSREIGLGAHELSDGDHTLELEAVQAGKEIGLDFLSVRP